MRVALLLPPPSLLHLSPLLKPAQLEIAENASNLKELLRTRRYDWVLFDPGATRDRTEEFAEIIEGFPSLPIAAYVQMTPSNLRSVFNLSQRGLRQVFVHPVRVEDVQFRNAFETAGGASISETALFAISDRIDSLPRAVRDVLIELFRRPYRFHTAADVASEAGLSRRALYCALSVAALPTPHRLVKLAKLIHGYFDFSRKETIRAACKRQRCSDPSRFSRDFRRHFNTSPRSIATHAAKDEVLLTVIETLCKPRQLADLGLARGQPRTGERGRASKGM